MNIFQGFRKLLFCVIAACTGMVVGYQLSRVLFANVRLCLGIGAVCAVILGILAFRFYRVGLFPVCDVHDVPSVHLLLFFCDFFSLSYLFPFLL